MSEEIDCEDCHYEDRCDKEGCQYDIDVEAEKWKLETDLLVIVQAPRSWLLQKNLLRWNYFSPKW